MELKSLRQALNKNVVCRIEQIDNVFRTYFVFCDVSSCFPLFPTFIIVMDKCMSYMDHWETLDSFSGESQDEKLYISKEEEETQDEEKTRRHWAIFVKATSQRQLDFLS